MTSQWLVEKGLCDPYETQVLELYCRLRCGHLVALKETSYLLFLTQELIFEQLVAFSRKIVFLKINDKSFFLIFSKTTIKEYNFPTPEACRKYENAHSCKKSLQHHSWLFELTRRHSWCWRDFFHSWAFSTSDASGVGKFYTSHFKTWSTFLHSAPKLVVVNFNSVFHASLRLTTSNFEQWREGNDHSWTRAFPWNFRHFQCHIL